MPYIVRAIIFDQNKLLVMDRDKYGFKFMSLLGGHVEEGETNEEAIIREVKEESSISVSNPRLVISIDSDNFGKQFIYLCDYRNGTAKLNPSSQEFLDNKKGKNCYLPKWISFDKIFRNKAIR